MVLQYYKPVTCTLYDNSVLSMTQEFFENMTVGKHRIGGLDGTVSSNLCLFHTLPTFN